MSLVRRAGFADASERRVPALGAVTAQARALCSRMSERAHALDADGGFPSEDLDDLARHGLLTAPLPRDLGGAGLGYGPDGARALMDVLRVIGAANLSVGRIYEGHVNAVGLVHRFGTQAQLRKLAQALHDGSRLGVWAAEAADETLELRGAPGSRRLAGRKILASGAGHLSHAIVPASDAAGSSFMLLVRPGGHERADTTGWTAHGMRASATGTVDLSGLQIAEDDIIGAAGDYLRQPDFSGGAWRFCAVQLGAMEALLDHFRDGLVGRGRAGDPLQRLRIAEAAMAVETARLWVERAACIMAGDGDADRIVAYVDLTRLVVERAALDLMDRLQRGIGLQALLRPNAVERIARDLRTYLRQPAPDAAMLASAATVLASADAAGDLWAGLG